MARARNHYEFLGLPEDASSSQIATAIRQFEDPAYALAYADPSRNEGLHQLLQRMRADLLSGPVRRRAYNRSLHPDMVLTLDGMDLVESRDGPGPDEAATVQGAGVRNRSRAVVAGLLLAATAPALGYVGLHRSAPAAAISPPTVAFVSIGTQPRHQRRVVQTVPLHWSRSSGAMQYRVEVKSGDSPAHPNVMRAVVTRNAYAFTGIGPRVYMWRVQARGRQGWGPYTLWHRFSVSAPSVGRPSGLRTTVTWEGTEASTHLCWNPVSTASAYTVVINGRQARNARGACATVALRSGRYVWSVAAQVEAARLLTGPLSRPDRIALTRPVPRRAHAHRTAENVMQEAPDAKTGVVAPTANTPILVAVALPPVSASTVTASTHARASVRTTTSRSTETRVASRARTTSSRSSNRPVATAVRVPVVHAVVPASASSSSTQGTTSSAVPPPPAPPAIPAPTSTPGPIPPPPPPPPVP